MLATDDLRQLMKNCEEYYRTQAQELAGTGGKYTADLLDHEARHYDMLDQIIDEGGAEVVPWLVGLLEHPFTDAREDAVDELKELAEEDRLEGQSKEAMAGLCRLLLRELEAPPEKVKIEFLVEIIRAIETIGTEEGVDAMRAVLDSPWSYEEDGLALVATDALGECAGIDFFSGFYPVEAARAWLAGDANWANDDRRLPPAPEATALPEQIRRIKGKLAEWRDRLPGSFRPGEPTGSGGKADPRRVPPHPLPESALAQFEEKHGVKLPADYRAFLKEIGNGGPGPIMGLVPLQDENVDVEGEEQLAGYLAKPCPLTYDKAANEDWEEQLPESLAELAAGTLHIAESIEEDVRLIVSGPAKGRVVYLRSAADQPYFPYDNNFLDWYERWLDFKLAGIVPLRFGVDNPDFHNPEEELEEEEQAV